MNHHEKSCGAVVYTREHGKREYLLVRQKRGVWGFPKGHVEAGETEEETALREIREETGVTVRIDTGFRRTETYPVYGREDTDKTVVYFTAEFEGQALRPDPGELRGAALFSYEEAERVLEWKSRRKILSEAEAFLAGKEEA